MEQLEHAIGFFASDASDGSARTRIPSSFDDQVRTIVNAVVPDGVVARADVLSRLTERHGFALLAFGERMAAYAVRTRQGLFIEEGLKALAIAWKLLYYKEVIPIISLLYRSADILGLEIQKLFVEAPYLNGRFQSVVKGIVSGSDAARSVRSMEYIESHDQDGFCYKRTW